MRAVQNKPEPELWELEPTEAARIKWERGRKRYGSTWVGRDPRVELLDELLDAMNYNGLLGEDAPIDPRELEALAQRVMNSLRASDSGARKSQAVCCARSA